MADWFVVNARPAAGIVYPVSGLARRHGAGAERETTSPPEAYGERQRKPVPYAGRLD